MTALYYYIIDKLDNKKTIIGICLWVLYQVSVGEGWIEPNNELLSGIYGLMAVGVADKLRKLTP